MLKGEKELAAEICAEFDQLTTVDRILIQGAARLLIRASRTGDGEIAVRATSEARRTLESLRRRYNKTVAMAPAPTESYIDIARRSAAEAAAARAKELAEDEAEEMAASAAGLTSEGDGS